MRVLPRSTERYLRYHQAATEPPEVSEDRVAAGIERERLRALILSHACAPCWGKQDIRSGPAGESILCCPILTEAGAGVVIRPEILEAARGCPIPALYGRVWAREQVDVTLEEIQGLVPRVEIPGADGGDGVAAADSVATAEPDHVRMARGELSEAEQAQLALTRLAPTLAPTLAAEAAEAAPEATPEAAPEAPAE